MKLSPATYFIFGCFSACCILPISLSQRSNSRQDRIQEWIRTIREAPKGHSMSPSWTRKARPQVIGVGALPLQNEAGNSVSSYPSLSYQKSKPSFSLKKFKNPFSGLRDGLRSKRYPKPAPPPVAISEDYSRPRENFRRNKNENVLSRYHEIETENVGGFKSLRKKKVPTAPINEQRPTIGYRPSQQTRPTKDLVPPGSSQQAGFPSLKPFGSDEYTGNFGFTRTKRPISDEPEISQDQNIRPKRRPSVFDFEEVEQQPQDGYNENFGFTRRPIEKRPNPDVADISQNIRPKRKPAVFDFEDSDFHRTPVGFNSVDDGISNSPRQQQISNERPYKPKFNFDSQDFNLRPKRQKKPVGPPQPAAPVQFNFDYDTEPIPKVARLPFKKAIPREPAFEYPSTFNHNKIYVRPAQQADLDFNSRPKRKRQFEGRHTEGRRFPFSAHEKPTNYVDFRARPRPNRKRFDNLIEGIPQVRTTTPRPIPTPGPMDFPRPPPRRPRPPPTHPTHPPMITHPPSHYETVTQRLPVPGVDFSFNEVSDSKIKDYDYKEYQDKAELEDAYQNENTVTNGNNQGFFSYPGAGKFPSLQQLGAGFESMKLSRKKRSAQEDPLMTSEARKRYRNRNFRNRRRLNNARDESRYRRGNNNRGNNNREPSRQGFGFENNFWSDGDANDFFSSGFDSFPKTGNRDTRANNYVNYEPEQVRYQDRGHYQEHNSYDPRPEHNSYNAGPEHNSYNSGPEHNAYNSGPEHNAYNSGPDSYNQQDRNSYDQNYYSHNTQGRDPYTEQTIQSYPPQEKFYSDPYKGYGEVVNNEILGSGNFEVIKGGTFYDDDTYYYSTYNSRPQYGEQLFENFRDFADIKNDRYRNRYPKY